MGRSKFNISLTNVSKKINYKYGLVKENDQRVVYLTGRGWIELTSLDIPHTDLINKIQRRFNRLVTRHLANGEIFSKDSINDFHMPLENIQTDKKRFMQFECLFRQNKNTTIDDIKEDIEKGVRKLSKELEFFLKENKFKISKTK